MAGEEQFRRNDHADSGQLPPSLLVDPSVEKIVIGDRRASDLKRFFPVQILAASKLVFGRLLIRNQACPA